MIYKHSRYNYCVKNKNQYILYNTLYNSLVRLENLEYLEYIKLNDCNPKLKDLFIKEGFFIEKHIDELKNYLLYVDILNKNTNSAIDFTITPTLECNARCFYCFENGVRNHSMTIQTANKIIDFIQSLDTSKGIKINWFGGEPLMNVDIMDYLSSSLKSHNIQFSSYMITNGSLINDDIISKMINSWNVKDVQITLDGTEEEYYLRKKYLNNEDFFYKILRNIKKMAKNNIFIHIRLNIDYNNIDNVCELIKDIEPIFYDFDNIIFYPAFLTGSKVKLSDRQMIDIVKKLFTNIKNPKKLTTNTKLYSYPRTTTCISSSPNSYCIDVNGDIFKCERLVGKKEYSIGNVYNNIKIDNQYFNNIRSECYECVFLPKCLGGCQSSYNSGDIPCFIEKYIIQAYLELL